ncbi:hypothetical protein B4113_1033 [Geobacillus sp. B4113_201601]|nr:hypothetical protein B4113_1033 [Geobacillus sp. B4113_201601]
MIIQCADGKENSGFDKLFLSGGDEGRGLPPAVFSKLKSLAAPSPSSFGNPAKRVVSCRF